MNTATDSALLAELVEAGIKLKLVDGTDLQVSAPKGRLSPDLRDRIVRNKAELIALLAQSRGQMSATAPSEPQVEHDAARLHEPFPPSDLQTSFLIGAREGFEHYVRPHQYMEFDYAELDPERFEQAVNRFLRRRAKDLVIARDDLTLQTVPAPQPVQIPVTDVRGAPEEEVRAAIEGVRASMERREPQFATWPWFDLHIVRHGDGRGRLHFNNNNLFCDAPSIMLFLDEVMRYYEDPHFSPPEIEIGFRDCVLELARIEDTPRGLSSKKYWCDRMADWPDGPPLPLAAGADPKRRSRLVRRELIIEPELWAALRRGGAARGLTPNSVLLGAHAELLAAWSGSRHFLLNNMITHRLPLHPQIGEVLGNFASLYPLEVDWRPDEPFRDRAERLQRQVMSDIEHSYWSGVKVLQTLNQVRRTPGRAVCPIAVGSALFVGRAKRPDYSTLETPQVRFDCEFWELADGSLWVVWDVIETMFPDGLIDAMEDGYRTALSQLAEGASAWESRALDLLPPAQSEQRAALNWSAAPPPAGLLHSPLARWAAATPSRPAVICGEEALDYAGLLDRSALLARRLGASGTKLGDLVAVMVPKSVAQVVAVHGVLGAGAAYVPMDPGWPAERISLLLKDAGVSGVVTVAALRERLAALTDVPILAVDAVSAAGTVSAVDPDGDDQIATLSFDADAAPQSPTDLAYVIYTSGSTGRPKGAMLDHRGPLNTISDVNRRFGIGSDDVIFGVSSLCFDLSVYDLFGSLAAGARLLLPVQSDPGSWLELVAAHGVTVWNSVPALMQLFVEAAESAGASFPALRTVLLSGDWIPVDLPERVRTIAPNATVISLGGATEASIWSICYPIGRVNSAWSSIPYGKPLANQTWHVLDEYGRDVPTWVPGELYIGGVGLAKGYLGDPERTAAAFVTHARTGEPLYRTGDLGRYLPDGTIEFLGRADFQVKIQGFRVEPGEIEHALLDHPQVGKAAVVARSSSSGKQLAAFVVASPDCDPAAGLVPEQLRSFLADRLPGYLVPSRITVLEALPLTGNGKLDRRALETMGSADEEQAREYAAARTPTEALLVEIWESVLGFGPIGVHDDFFELGGQSFAALRVISALAQRRGERVSLGALLEHRTIGQLASWLDSSTRSWSPLVQLRAIDAESRAGAVSTPWFLVHPAGGNVLCYEGLAALLSTAVYAFQAPGPANGNEPLDRIEDLAGLYLRVLRSARPHGPYRLGAWSSGATVALELAYRLEQAGEHVERIVVIDAPAPEPRASDDTQILLWFLEDLGTGFAAREVSPPEISRLAQLQESERTAAALEIARAHGMTDLPLSYAEIEAALPVFRGVIRACERYRPPVIAADITVVRACDGLVSEFDGHPAAHSPDWGWAALTTGSVEAVYVPGSHYTLLDASHIAAVADALGRQSPSARTEG